MGDAGKHNTRFHEHNPIDTLGGKETAKHCLET